MHHQRDLVYKKSISPEPHLNIHLKLVQYLKVGLCGCGTMVKYFNKWLDTFLDICRYISSCGSVNVSYTHIQTSALTSA